MLAKTTIEIICSALKSDPSTTPADRKRIINFIQRGPQQITAVALAEDRILRRTEAAKRLGCSVRMIDRLATEGLLPKRKLPGRTRAHGIAESDLAALILTSNPQQQDF